jgi:hypothetical protein
MKIAIKEIETASWILNEDNEFECSHDLGSRVETGEVDTMRNGEHDTYEVRYYVCADYDCEAELDGNPDEDAHDAMVDAQIDEMRGK